MTSYYMLMSSLPRHSRQYKVNQTPISRIQLEKRLKLLSETENLILINLISCVWESGFNPNLSFQATLANCRSLLALNNPFINNMIAWFFDLRSLLVALRLRRIQSSPPTNSQNVWFTRWNTRIIKNWHIPDFTLQPIYPWLAEVSTKLSNKECYFIEETFLTLSWKYLEKIEHRHFYDFEALIIYLMRWHIVNYWSQLNEKIAAERIGKLADTLPH